MPFRISRTELVQGNPFITTTVRTFKFFLLMLFTIIFRINRTFHAGYTCEKCFGVDTCIALRRVEEAPEYLIVSIGRFIGVGINVRKDNSEVMCDDIVHVRAKDNALVVSSRRNISLLEILPVFNILDSLDILNAGHLLLLAH